MRWFRFYDDALDDPKVQRLPPHLFKSWINLLCLASKGEGQLQSIDDIAFRLRISVQDAAQQIDDLILAGLIDIDAQGNRVPHNWSARQFTSDCSTERVRKYRGKTKIKDGNVSCNVSETPQIQNQNQNQSQNQNNARADARDRDGIKNFKIGLVGRGVSPRLLAKAEGLGLDARDLAAQAQGHHVKHPDALFRHLCVSQLQTKLPRASPGLLKAALTRDGAAAFGTVCQMILEAP